MSKAELRDTGSNVLFGVTGGQGECLACNKPQVMSLFGAVLLNSNIWQDYPFVLNNQRSLQS